VPTRGARADVRRATEWRTETQPEPKIEELLKEGQEIIVQVAKEPLGTKGARLTSHATMPGRFLVFMPTVDHVGVSRKIDSRESAAACAASSGSSASSTASPAGSSSARPPPHARRKTSSPT
jgi:Rne/Rng family ribonuclease